MSNWKYTGNTTKPGNPLWNEYVETDSDGNTVGRSTLEVHTPIKISNFDSCDHVFEYKNDGNDAVCSRCGLGQKIVLGIHKIKDGKVITLNSKL